MSRLVVVTGDITQLCVDAIVNAANERMLGGGGVDGAIHRAAGPELLAACRACPEVRPGVRCPTGQACITPGFQLPAKYVIHTAGPIWQGGKNDEVALLASCYRTCLALAAEHGLHTIAFPALSTGVYGFPLDRASQVAVAEARRFLREQPEFRCITLVAFTEGAASTLRDAVMETE
jgi:O-acetyl-ADP-ribose deacetylase (regulator of RNase III)